MMLIIGCDFSSSPSKRKPIVVAVSEPFQALKHEKSAHLAQSLGRNKHGLLSKLERLERFENLQTFGQWLCDQPAWIGGFDLPFGLPRELINAMPWPVASLSWLDVMRFYASLSRAQIREDFKAFCDVRPVGGKFAHRACDGPAGSSPSMKWVNPPVAYMMHAGVPLLLEAGCHIPRLLERPAASKVALEAYPGLLAREIIGQRSYKSDTTTKQTAERLIARKDILTALESGQTRLGLRLKLSNAQRETLIDDASGDSLDAVICMLQASWAQLQHEAGHAHYGLPECDPLEGWIVTASGSQTKAK